MLGGGGRNAGREAGEGGLRRGLRLFVVNDVAVVVVVVVTA
jgi:hypothetical protein